MLFKRFFVVSGSGLSGSSSLMAFDRALLKAGIAQCNLVAVSSIIPLGAREVKPVSIKPGTVTFTVLSREDGVEGEGITAGIAWASCSVNGNETYGIVVEDHGRKTTVECRRDLKKKLGEMARARGIRVLKCSYEIASVKRVPDRKFGCVVAALVYV